MAIDWSPLNIIHDYMEKKHSLNLNTDELSGFFKDHISKLDHDERTSLFNKLVERRNYLGFHIDKGQGRDLNSALGSAIAAEHQTIINAQTVMIQYANDNGFAATLSNPHPYGIRGDKKILKDKQIKKMKLPGQEEFYKSYLSGNYSPQPNPQESPQPNPQESAPARAIDMEKLKEKPRQAFKDAQAKYKEILDKSKLLEAATEEEKKSFLSKAKTDEEKELISESKYKEFQKARQEVFNEYKQQVIDARRSGNLKSIRVDPQKKEEVLKFLDNIGERIAEKMYGKNIKDLTQSERNALLYFGSRNASESYNKAIKVRQEALGKLLDKYDKIKMIKPDDLKSVMTGRRNAGGRNAAKQIEENGFKFGKGKVAMAVMGLAGLAGVTSLMFSGGRQQNSNLYNANQAMY